MKKFTSSHEWIDLEGTIARVGITQFAKDELGEIVYIELPLLNHEIKKGKEIVVLESTKAAADLYCPLSGKILEINEALKENLNLINEDPENQGWLFKIHIIRPKELDELLSQEEYLSIIQ